MGIDRGGRRLGSGRGAESVRRPRRAGARVGANGYAVRDAVAREGEEREIVTTYLAARETAERAELGAASRSEVEQAIEDLRSVFYTFLSQAGLEPE